MDVAFVFSQSPPEVVYSHVGPPYTPLAVQLVYQAQAVCGRQWGAQPLSPTKTSLQIFSSYIHDPAQRLNCTEHLTPYNTALGTQSFSQAPMLKG